MFFNGLTGTTGLGGVGQGGFGTTPGFGAGFGAGTGAGMNLFNQNPFNPFSNPNTPFQSQGLVPNQNAFQTQGLLPNSPQLNTGFNAGTGAGQTFPGTSGQGFTGLGNNPPGIQTGFGLPGVQQSSGFQSSQLPQTNGFPGQLSQQQLNPNTNSGFFGQNTGLPQSQSQFGFQQRTPFGQQPSTSGFQASGSGNLQFPPQQQGLNQGFNPIPFQGNFGTTSQPTTGQMFGLVPNYI